MNLPITFPHSLQPLNATPPAQQCRRKRWSGNTNKISGEFCLDQARPSLLGDKDRTQLPHRGNQAHRDTMVSSPPSCPKNHILKHRRHSQAPFFYVIFLFKRFCRLHHFKKFIYVDYLHHLLTSLSVQLPQPSTSSFSYSF